MPEIEATVEFEVFCDSCSTGLCNRVRVKGNKIYVEPCQRCLDSARADGYDSGYIDCQQEVN